MSIIAKHGRNARGLSRREGLFGALGVLGSMALSSCRAGSRAPSERLPSELRVDWAYYSPLSMVVRKKEWLEEHFASARV
ncbi:MAG TPA: hypothetical protein VNO21_26915, partial [Polyangiaceae bacterium]|nr:hypothetical protein [Polyangiaceae bacterium]